MKNSLFLYIFLFSIISFAQKQNSLLWEISGNGLTKNSYVYGTMHVNDKISYHLSDAFFKHLLEADIVSNESDPQTWDAMLPVLRPNIPITSSAFYASFYQKPIEKIKLKTLFSTNNYFNSLLSGINGSSADYQEDTVLDLFIFQTGKKYNKKIVGLEDTMESILTVMKMTPEDSQPDEKRTEVLIKFLKGKNFKEAMNDYYRSKDVVMLDSLYKLLFSKRGHQLMITQRNAVMAKSIDSLSHTGSLFAAIGAAHLSGSQGVLQMLKNKGFTITPIFDAMTNKGESQKQTIETYFPQPNLNPTSTKDGMVVLPLNTATVVFQNEVGSPDFTNGGAISIKRLPLNSYLNSNNQNFDVKQLDSLFYENIPGKIITKKYFETDFERGYEIVNTTKTGNFQHRKFFITPLEIIVVSMIGNGEYTKLYDSTVFNNIKFKKPDQSWTIFEPEKGGFAITVPSYYFATGNTTTNLENLDIQAFDAKNKSYYFLQERTLATTADIEDAEFEQKQIHFEYYLQNNVEMQEFLYNPNQNSFQSSSQIGSQKIELQSFVKGAHYYLLGSVNAPKEDAGKFFDSFTLDVSFLPEVFQTYQDSVNNYSVSIPKKTNAAILYDLGPKDYAIKNQFSGKAINKMFVAANGQTVDLYSYQYPKYDSFTDEKEIRDYLLKTILKLPYQSYYKEYYNDENPYAIFLKKGLQKSIWDELTTDKSDEFILIQDDFVYDKEEQTATLDAFVIKANAAQGIKYKAFVQPNQFYLLSALVDKNPNQKNAVVDSIFNSFKVTSDLQKSDESKLDLFIKDANSTSDTIRFSAMNSLYYLSLKNADFDKVSKMITSFQFKSSETEAFNELIKKIGLLDDSQVTQFLTSIYRQENVLTSTQIAILETLAERNDKIAYKIILNLLEFDLPLSSQSLELDSFFKLLTENAENSKMLFPAIFQFYTIPEYKQHVLTYTNYLLENGWIAPKKLQKFKKVLFTNAKLEYKRVLSWKQKNTQLQGPTMDAVTTLDAEDYAESEIEITTESDYIVDANEAPTQALLDYLGLLQNFSGDDAIDSWIKKLVNLNINKITAEVIRLRYLSNELTNSQIQNTLQNQELQFVMLQLMANSEDFSFLKKLSEIEIAKAAVTHFQNGLELKSMEFLEEKEAIINGVKIKLYFFSSKEKPNGYGLAANFIAAVAFAVQNNAINPLAYKILDLEVVNSDQPKQTSTMLSKFINGNHKRANFEKQENDSGAFMIDEY